MDGLTRNAYERRIARLEDEKKEMARKLNDSNRALQRLAHGSSAGAAEANAAEDNSAEVQALREELDLLSKRNSGTLNKLITQLLKNLKVH
jgi:hypothetical protein